MEKCVIFGATSAMALEAAKLFASDRMELFLVARNAGKLEAVRKDLETRGAKVTVYIADLADTTTHPALFSKIGEVMPDYDSVLVAYGVLPDQAACEADFNKAKAALDVNFISTVSILTEVSNHFSSIKKGTLAVISSVAGDRGRKSNYVYGAAKGALTIFLGGLRQRLANDGVDVVTIKPGFVDTPMTVDVPKNALFASSAKAGSCIYQAMLKKKNIAYVPGFWRWIMLIVVHIPEFIFKKQNKIA